MKGRIRDFWIILMLCYGLMGIRLKAEDSGLKKALILMNEGRSDEAVGVLNREAGKSSVGPDTYLALGVAYLEKNEYGLARENLEKVLELKPESVAAHYSLAMLHEKQGDIAGAVAEWEKVRRLTDDRDVRDLADKHIRQLKGVR